MEIRNPTELKTAIHQAVIHQAVNNENNEYNLRAIAKYKWFNYYIQTNYELGSDEDRQIENEFIFLEETNPQMHRQIELLIDEEVGISLSEEEVVEIQNQVI